MSSNDREFTIGELESFVENRIWKAIVTMAVNKSNDIADEIFQLDPLQEATRISRLQGSVKALSDVLDYPALLKEQIEYEQRGEKK
jgi:hypothetical protein